MMQRQTCKRSTTRALASLAFGAFSLYAGRADAAVCEAEPTDMSVDYGERVTCDLSPGSDTDLYRFSGVSGSRILAEVLFVSGAGFVPQLQLIAPDGLVLDIGARADRVLPQTGTYTVFVAESGANNTGEYAFTVSCTSGACTPIPPPPPPPPPGGDIQCEPEPTDMFPHYGTRVTCDITPGSDTDLYRFVANAGDRIFAEVLVVSGAGFVPQLELIAPDGLVLDIGARADRVLPQTGTYTVFVAESGANNAGEYAFTVSCTGGKCLPPGASPHVVFTLTGCTVCNPGDQFTVEAHWSNRGEASVRAEVKAGFRLPNGTTSNSLGNKHLEVLFPASFDVTANLLSFVWPVGLPTGTWTFEGALLGPDLGETFAREVRTFTVEP